MATTNMLAVVATGAALALGSSVLPAAAQSTIRDVAATKAGVYKVDTYHTQVVFSLSHFGFTNFAGTFSDAAGSLQLDPKNIAATKLEISIPVQSVLTPVPKLNEELKAADWFDAAKYPAATFKSTRVTATGTNMATIEGNLSMHGVTKPVSLKAKFLGAGINPINKAYTVGFEATGTVKRSDFGVTKYVPLVGDDVHLTLAGAFELQP